MLKKLIVPAFVGFVLAPAIASSATLKELEERITQLEEEALIASEGVYELSTNDESRMKLSGYTDVEYHTSTQQGSVDHFRLHHMSLFFEKSLGDKWHFFSEIEYEDAPKFEGAGDPQTSGAGGEIIEDAEGKIFVEAVNLTYRWNQTANFRIGRMFTPGGIWNVDHYPAFVPTQERPLHIRKMFPQVMDGVQVFGTFAMGNAFANYDLYYVNGNGNIGKNDKNQTKATGARLSFVLPALDHLELGASVYTDSEDTSNNDEGYSATGVHGKATVDSITLQFEQAASGWDVDEREGYYVQLLYDWDKYTFGVRNDFYDEDADDSATDSGVVQNSVFVNYHVNKNVTLKAEYHALDNEDDATEDYNKAVFSVVGYLGN